LASNFNGLFSRFQRSPREPRNLSRQSGYFWALKDVSFDLKQGETLGIIGRNGAGKSTLLKILSRITEPTSGRAEIYGRLGSLLEVGTGFDRDLTGRENIYLNGAVLGMTKREIDRKFDEIVDFSGVEKFIDTPVKRYSSGMYVRLGFAVAAHLEPEILIVDEVLAVGDVEFRQKCQGKMDEVAKQGRAVVFVSHSLSAVESLCSRGIVLDAGTIVHSGAADECVAYYLERFFTEDKTSLAERTTRAGTGKIRLTEVFFEMEGRRSAVVQTGKPCTVCLRYRAEDEEKNVGIGFSIRDRNAQSLSILSSADTLASFSQIPKEGVFRCMIDRVPLIPGRYRLNTTIDINRVDADYVEGAAFMIVEEGDFFGTGRVNANVRFPVLLDHKWVLGR
jgi:lipopolysaccharide transport system ATP-binding protein